MPKDFHVRARRADIARAIDRATTSDLAPRDNVGRYDPPALSEEEQRSNKILALARKQVQSLKEPGMQAVHRHLDQLSSLRADDNVELSPGVAYFLAQHISRWQRCIKSAQAWSKRQQIDVGLLQTDDVERTWAELFLVCEKQGATAQLFELINLA